MPGPWWPHSAHGPARRELRVRHSPPGPPRKILSELISGARWAGSGLPAEHPSCGRPSAAAQTMDGTRQRFRSVSFACRKVCYRQVALTRRPSQAVVSAPPTCRKPPRTPPEGTGGLSCPAHPLPPPRFLLTRRSLPAPGTAFGPRLSVRVLSWTRSAAPCPECGEPESDSSPGAGLGAAETHAAAIHAGCGRFPAGLGNGPRSGTSGSRLAARLAPPLVLVDAILAEVRADHCAAPMLFKSDKEHLTEFLTIPFPRNPSGERESLRLYSFRPHPRDPTGGIPALPFPAAPVRRCPARPHLPWGAAPGARGAARWPSEGRRRRPARRGPAAGQRKATAPAAAWGARHCPAGRGGSAGSPGGGSPGFRWPAAGGAPPARPSPAASRWWGCTSRRCSPWSGNSACGPSARTARRGCGTGRTSASAAAEPAVAATPGRPCRGTGSHSRSCPREEPSRLLRGGEGLSEGGRRPGRWRWGGGRLCPRALRGRGSEPGRWQRRAERCRRTERHCRRPRRPAEPRAPPSAPAPRPPPPPPSFPGADRGMEGKKDRGREGGKEGGRKGGRDGGKRRGGLCPTVGAAAMPVPCRKGSSPSGPGPRLLPPTPYPLTVEPSKAPGAQRWAGSRRFLRALPRKPTGQGFGGSSVFGCCLLRPSAAREWRGAETKVLSKFCRCKEMFGAGAAHNNCAESGCGRGPAGSLRRVALCLSCSPRKTAT